MSSWSINSLWKLSRLFQTLKMSVQYIEKNENIDTKESEFPHWKPLKPPICEQYTIFLSFPYPQIDRLPGIS
jgi:hypothetical protein